MSKADPGIWHDQRRMLPPLTVGLMIGGFYVTAAGSLIATLSRDLRVSPASLAFLGSAFGVGMLVSGLAAPFLLRYGPVWNLRFAPLLAAIGTLLTLWSLNAAVAITGVTLACFGATLVTSAVAGTFTGVEGGKYLALVNGVSSAVSILTTILIALVERLFPGFGRLAVLFAFIAIIPTFILAWRLPAVPFATFIKPLKAVEESPAEVTRKAPKSLLAWQIVRLILVAGVEFAMYAWAVTRLQQVGLDLAAASAFATAFAVGMALGRIFGARFTALRPAWYVFLALGALGTALTAYSPLTWSVTGGLVLAGLGVSCLYPIGASEFSGLPGVKAHNAAGVISILSGTGALVTPLLLGILLNAIGLQMSFAVLLVFYAALLVIPRPRG